MAYFIKDGYTERLDNEACDQREAEDECQNEVYAYAAALPDVKSVLDVGTGSGFKLMKYFRDVYTMGLDVEPNLSWLKRKYPDRDWMQVDLATAGETGFDLLICSDVIEHFPDPEVLLGFIARCDARLLVISTPDRDALHEVFWNGPPRNPCHCREWSSEEFAQYMGSKFEILDHVLPKKKDYSTQWVLANGRLKWI